MSRYIYILLTILSLCCVSCNTGSDSFNPMERYNTVVTVIHGVDGLGDMGYNDLVALGSAKAEKQRSLIVNRLTPRSMDEADEMIHSWIDHKTGDATRRLLIVGADSYESLVRKYADQITDDADERVLLLGSGNDLNTVHTISIPYYGACYKVGYLSAMLKDMLGSGWKEKKTLVVCANPNVAGITEGRDGFLDGYADYANGHDVDVEYLDDGLLGFEMQNTVYYRCFGWIRSYSLVFPLCGGSANGLYDFCHEYYDYAEMVAIGIDADKSFYGGVPFSVVKNMDKVVYDYILKWYDRRTMEPHQRIGLAEGGTDIIISVDSQVLQEAAEKIHNKAVEREKQLIMNN